MLDLDRCTSGAPARVTPCKTLGFEADRLACAFALHSASASSSLTVATSGPLLRIKSARSAVEERLRGVERGSIRRGGARGEAEGSVAQPDSPREADDDRLGPKRPGDAPSAPSKSWSSSRAAPAEASVGRGGRVDVPTRSETTLDLLLPGVGGVEMSALDFRLATTAVVLPLRDATNSLLFCPLTLRGLPSGGPIEP